jgi:hypothetical protein
MAEEAAVGDRVCLRCDWTGETDGETCPRCGAALYRIPESTKPREVTPPPHPQPEPSGDRMSGSSIEETQDGESFPPAVPVAANRRWWVIAGGAFAVAAVWVVSTGGPFARTDAPTASGPAFAVATTPVNEPPTVNPADAAAEEVARGFLDAYAAFDAQKAMTYVADDADLRNLIDPSDQVPANAEGLSLRLSLLHAIGVDLTVTSCEAAPIGSDTSVVCESVFHALGSDQIGRGPFSNSPFVFTVRDGAIVRVGFVPEPLDEFDRQMWEPFAEWVSSTYPKDATVMYLDGTLDTARFSLESIRLWERRTREYAETRLAGEPDVQRAAGCSFVQPPARAHLELTDFGDTIKARFVLHQMTLPGHRWRIVLAKAHPSGFFPQADEWRPLFEGTRLATGDSGDITVQRSVRNSGSLFVRAKARDRQTGQFCRVTKLDAGLVSL